MQARIALSLVGVGLVLLGYMVAVEGEPGALPLALVVGGTVWYLLARRRRRNPGATGKQ